MTEMPSLCQHSTDKHDAIGCWRQLGRPTRPGLEAAEKTPADARIKKMRSGPSSRTRAGRTAWERGPGSSPATDDGTDGSPAMSSAMIATKQYVYPYSN